jgi:benzoyl-CoA reductase subunit D
MLCGCDVGSSAVKLVVLDPSGSGLPCFAHSERIRRRPPGDVVQSCFAQAERAGFTQADFSYIAATGDESAVPQRSGHFFAMTCHARAARQYVPGARSLLDLGALHLRAIILDPRGRVTDYRMTGQCASGAGHFLENIARYLGLSLERLAQLSLEATHPPPLSTVCTVLAETDIVNLVAREVPLANIVRAMHDMIARRAVKLIASLPLQPPLILTGGLANDRGLVQALSAALAQRGLKPELRVLEQPAQAGAIGAALWGGWRKRRMQGDLFRPG